MLLFPPRDGGNEQGVPSTLYQLRANYLYDRLLGRLNVLRFRISALVSSGYGQLQRLGEGSSFGRGVPGTTCKDRRINFPVGRVREGYGNCLFPLKYDDLLFIYRSWLSLGDHGIYFRY